MNRTLVANYFLRRSKKIVGRYAKSRVFKSRKEVVIDAVKEMAVRYGLYSKETARDILNERISGKLSETVRAVRDE